MISDFFLGSHRFLGNPKRGYVLFGDPEANPKIGQQNRSRSAKIVVDESTVLCFLVPFSIGFVWVLG